MKKIKKVYICKYTDHTKLQEYLFNKYSNLKWVKSDKKIKKFNNENRTIIKAKELNQIAFRVYENSLTYGLPDTYRYSYPDYEIIDLTKKFEREKKFKKIFKK